MRDGHRPTAARIDALEDAFAEAIFFIVHNTRNIIECGTRDYDLKTANKETRAGIEANNALLDRLNTVLNGTAHPAGICRFCRCTHETPCELPDGEPCAWFTGNVCTNEACMRAYKLIAKNETPAPLPNRRAR